MVVVFLLLGITNRLISGFAALIGHNPDAFQPADIFLDVSPASRAAA
jgi:hypothetical protein